MTIKHVTATITRRVTSKKFALYHDAEAQEDNDGTIWSINMKKGWEIGDRVSFEIGHQPYPLMPSRTVNLTQMQNV